MKRKDYLRLFVDYARKNEIGFEIYYDGSLRRIDMGFAPVDLMLGTKAAYDWLVKTHKGETE